MQAFKLTETDIGGQRREIQVHGELDLAVADQLQQALDRAGQECSEVLIGLESCEFIDSTGIAAIVVAYGRLSESGKRLALHSCSSQVRRILTLTGLTGNGLVFESRDEALEGSRAEAPDPV